MSQKPIDFAHWAMFFGGICLFTLWFSLPSSITKKVGLILMTLGIGFSSGMCVIDFLLWAQEDQEARNSLYHVIFNTPSIQIPFLVVGPALFYMGISIATYGLFKKYIWQVVVLNIGALMIGLGHMVFQNHTIPAIGAAFFALGLGWIIWNQKK